jgi:putative peptidoglycan lipid II flippase
MRADDDSPGAAMFKKILSVGGFTLLSRLSGFVRDIVLAAVLGAGALMDAFSVALRLPNHFRAIFGEGAVNQAYIPAYAAFASRAARRRPRCSPTASSA